MATQLYKHYQKYLNAASNEEKASVASELEEFIGQRKTRECALTTHERSRLAAAWELLGRIYFELGDPVKPQTCFLTALNLFDELSSKIKSAQVAVQLAMFYLSQDRQQEAEEMLMYYEELHTDHFGSNHFQSRNAKEMCEAVENYKGLSEQLSVSGSMPAV